jgi:hypothetical protein
MTSSPPAEPLQNGGTTVATTAPPRQLAAVVPPASRQGLQGLGRPMFLRWFVLQSVVATVLVAAGLAYGSRLHGASLAMVPLILAVLAGASGYAGLLAWRLDAGSPVAGGLRHLWFAAGLSQLLGLPGTVAGFYAMFNEGGAADAASPSGDLAARVTHGASVALSATFVSIFSSIVILLEHHVLDRGD